MYCTQCGEMLAPGSRFCGNCGWQVMSGPAWREEVAQREARGLKLCVACRSEIPLAATVCHRCDASQPVYSANLWAPQTPSLGRTAGTVVGGPAGAGGGVAPVQAPSAPATVVVTESVEYASIGRRGGAHLLDLFLIIVVSLILFEPLGIEFDPDNPLDGAGIWVIYGLMVGYYVVTEALFGQSLGKRMAGIRVQSADGGGITWGQALARNTLRIIDGLPGGVYIVGLIAMSRNDQLQRLGDKAAGTVVIMDK